jgi:hypothetical protein
VVVEFHEDEFPADVAKHHKVARGRLSGCASAERFQGAFLQPHFLHLESCTASSRSS